MSILGLPRSYFAIPDPLRLIERWIHRNRYHQSLSIDGRVLELRWTGRAQRALECRREPLIVELQLLFSCVVKKRVLFHDRAPFERVPVAGKIEIAFHPVASAACDPVEFARDYPVDRSLDGVAARKMVLPNWVEIDYRRGAWEGRFGY